MSRRIKLVATGATLVLSAVAALTIAAGTNTSTGGERDANRAETGMKAGYEAASQGVTATDSYLQSNTSGASRELIIQTRAVLRADDPVVTLEKITTRLQAVNGRVENLSRQTGTEGTVITVTMRVPVKELDTTIANLEKFGKVEEISTTKSDVTVVVRDLDARIEALQASTVRLLELIKSAGGVTQLLEVERSLTERQAELDGLRAQRQVYAEQVALAELNLSIYPAASFEAPRAPGFSTGFSKGKRLLGDATATALTGAGIAVPFLLSFGTAGLLTLLLLRRRARRNIRRAEETK